LKEAITHHNRLFQLTLVALQLTWFIFKLFSKILLRVPFSSFLQEATAQPQISKDATETRVARTVAC